MLPSHTSILQYDIILPAPKKKQSTGKLKAQPVPQADPGSEDSMPAALLAATSRCATMSLQSIAAAEAMADALVAVPMSRSRRSSMGSSYSSDRDLSVPASEFESDGGSELDIEHSAEAPRPKKKVCDSQICIDAIL